MIITVASFKGGVGKTTTAVHLAAFLNESSPALLIDGDPNRSARDGAVAAHCPSRLWMNDRPPDTQKTSAISSSTRKPAERAKI